MECVQFYHISQVIDSLPVRGTKEGSVLQRIEPGSVAPRHASKPPTRDSGQGTDHIEETQALPVRCQNPPRKWARQRIP